MAFPRFNSYELSQQTQQQQAQGEQNALAAAKSRAVAAGNVAQTGYTLGSIRDPALYGGRSMMRPDQTNAERLAEQRANFFYGGTASGAQDATGALRANVGPYAQTMGQYGDAFMGQARTGASMFMPGMAGTYGTAGALTDLAMQGPGPSVAQAQLDASTANAQRAQLALAGSGRGQGGGASAMRGALQNQATIQGQANAQAAVLRANEADMNRRTQAGMLAQAGGLYGQGGDLAARYATGMGGLGLGAQQGAAQTQLGIEQGVHGINMGALGANTGYEQLLNQIYGVDRGVALQNAQLAAQQDAAMWGAIGTGVTTAATVAAMASDITAKTDIAPAPELSGGPLARYGPVDSLPSGGTIPLPGGPPQKTVEEAQKERENAQLRAALAGQLGGFTTGLGTALSDERGKVGQVMAPRAALSAVEHTNPWQYQYKDPARHGQGQHFGPMAQELAQTPAGRSTLVRMPDGKLGVDTGRLSLVNTAAQAAKAKEDRVRSRELELRLKDLENKFRRVG